MARASLLSVAGLALGRLYERERWQAEAAMLRHQLSERALVAPSQDRAGMRVLAAAVAHEVNAPLLAARASLALLNTDRPGSALVAGAQADLARIAATMETLNALAQEAPLGQRLEQIVARAAARGEAR